MLTQTSTTAPAGWPATSGTNAVNYGMEASVVTSRQWGPKMVDALKAIPTWSIVMDLDDLFSRTGFTRTRSPSGPHWRAAG